MFGRRGYGAEGDAEFGGSSNSGSSGGKSGKTLKESPFFGSVSARSSASLFLEIDGALQLAAAVCAVRANATKGRRRAGTELHAGGFAIAKKQPKATPTLPWTWCGDPSAFGRLKTTTSTGGGASSSSDQKDEKAAEKKKKKKELQTLSEKDNEEDEENDGDNEEEKEETNPFDVGGGNDSDGSDNSSGGGYGGGGGGRRRRRPEVDRGAVMAAAGHDDGDESGDELTHLFEDDDRLDHDLWGDNNL